MTTIWVLTIFVVALGGVSVSTHEYTGEQSCKIAGLAIEKRAEEVGSGAFVFTVCAER